jgi:hypothetical protein
MNGKLWLRVFRLPCFLVAMLCFSAAGVFAEPLAVGSQIAQFTLPAPDSEKSQAYLGLKTREPFAFSAIKAKLVLIEFLSVT